MFDKKILTYFISIISSVAIIALIIILLPSIIIAVTTLILIFMIISLILRFLITKKVVQENFIYINRKYNFDKDKKEDYPMKDVTNSNKKE